MSGARQRVDPSREDQGRRRGLPSPVKSLALSPTPAAGDGKHAPPPAHALVSPIRNQDAQQSTGPALHTSSTSANPSPSRALAAADTGMRGSRQGNDPWRGSQGRGRGLPSPVKSLALSSTPPSVGDDERAPSPVHALVSPSRSQEALLSTGPAHQTSLTRVNASPSRSLAAADIGMRGSRQGDDPWRGRQGRGRGLPSPVKSLTPSLTPSPAGDDERTPSPAQPSTAPALRTSSRSANLSSSPSWRSDGILGPGPGRLPHRRSLHPRVQPSHTSPQSNRSSSTSLLRPDMQSLHASSHSGPSSPITGQRAGVQHPPTSPPSVQSSRDDRGISYALAMSGKAGVLLESRQADLVHFLNTFKDSRHNCELFKAQLNMAEELGWRELTIDFDDLLKANRDLALTICNEQGRNKVWLTRAANQFFNQNGVSTKDATINFINMPARMQSARDALTSTDPLVKPNDVVERRSVLISCTPRGSQILDAIITGVLKRLENGESWLGKLELDKMEFIERSGRLHLVINQDPLIIQNATPKDKVLDVRSIWPLVEPFYKLDGKLPVYFEELKKDLQGASETNVEKVWFHEYLRFHPAIMPSIGRRFFEFGLHHEVKSSNLAREGEFRSLFSQKPMSKDWRGAAIIDDVLGVVYNYEFEKSERKTQKGDAKLDENTKRQSGNDLEEKTKGEDQSGKEKAQKREGKSRDAEGKIPKRKEQSVNDAEDKIQKVEQPGDVVDANNGNGEEEGEKAKTIRINRHPDTMWGLLEHRRHALEHADEHFKMDDLDEIELYIANFFPFFLPYLIKRLLRQCQMRRK